MLKRKIRKRAFEALIFDLDGVLIDSTEGIVDSTNHTLSRLGLPSRTAEEIVPYIGSPLPEMFADFAPGVEYSRISPLFRARAREVIVSSSELLPHARETLQLARSTGYRVGIGSTKIRPHIEGVIEKFSLESSIDAFTGGDEATAKPEPDIFHLTAERLGVRAEATLVIGDTINDVLAAQRAGMNVVTIESKFGDRRSLLENPAEMHYSSLLEFCRFAICDSA